MLLNSLPPEIILYILSYLPISSLSQVYSVSKSWKTFLFHHETAIYRHAAFLHGFIDNESASLESPELKKKYSDRVLANVDSWKTLCKIRMQVRNAWKGISPSKTEVVSARDPFFYLFKNTHRIKVDEKRGLIMTTTAFNIPRVHVRDMNTGAPLWRLDPSMGRHFAHLEYSEGFLIFDRDNGDREVWRLADSALRDTVHAVPFSEIPHDFDETSKPDSGMLLDSQFALNKSLNRSPSDPRVDFWPRGSFEPYALLHGPEETRAYRFVYPTLLTAARDKVYLWDIPSARIVEVVQGIQRATVPEPSKAAPGEDIFFDAQENFDPESQGRDDGYMSETNTGSHQGSPEVNEEESIHDDDSDEGISSDEDTSSEDLSSGEYSDEEDDSDEGEDDLDDDSDDEADVRPYHIPSDLSLLRSIRYVDHSPTHVFLVGQFVLKIFCRADFPTIFSDEVGASTNPNASHHLALSLTSTKYRYGRWRYTIRPGSGKQASGSCLVRYEMDVDDGENLDHTKTLYDLFTAVHVSPCGSHIVVLLKGARILILPHFRQLVGKSEEDLYNSILDVQLSSPYSTRSIYLAYEEGDGGEGRVGVVTTGAVFIVALPPFPLNNRTNTPPVIQVSRVKEWLDKSRLDNVSCLMLSDTRLFVNYDPVISLRHGAPSHTVQDWEREFEADLTDLQALGDDCYHTSERALFVKYVPQSNAVYESTVHEVNMLPS